MPSNHDKTEISAEHASENMQRVGRLAPINKITLVPPINLFTGPKSESQKSHVGSEGLPSGGQHERTSEQFNAQGGDNLPAVNSNPRNKSTFSKQMGSQESSLESSSRQMRGTQKIRGGRTMQSGAQAAITSEPEESSALKMRRNKKSGTAAQVQGKVTGRWTDEEHQRF